MKFERTIYALVCDDSKKQYIKCYADKELAEMKEAVIREANPGMQVRIFTIPFEDDNTIYGTCQNYFRRTIV